MANIKACVARALKHKRITERQAEQILRLVAVGDEAQRILEEFISKTAEARRVHQLQVLALSRASQEAASHSAGMGKGIEALLARDVFERASYSNVDFRTRAVYDKVRAMAAAAYEKLRVRRLGLVTDDGLAERVGRALFGEPADPEAEALAKELSSAMDMLRIRANVAGAHIPKRKDFGLPQTHDVRRIAAATKAEWVSFTLPKVKRIYTEGGQVLEDPGFIAKYLETTYDQAVDAANRLGSGEAGIIKLETESRRIIFKGYDDWKAYSNVYGHGEKDLLNIVDDHLRGSAREVALMEILGPRPKQTLERLMEQAASKGQLTPWQRNRIERLFNVVSGETDGVQTQWLANGSAFIRSWLVASQLGSAVISSFSDIVTGAMARHVNGMPLARAFDGILRGMSRAEAARLGIAADMSLLALQNSKWGELAGASKFSSRAADFVLRASGLTNWTEAGRRAFGIELLAHFGDQVAAGRKFADLSDALKRQLPKYGITAELWDNVVLRVATIEKHGAHFLDLDGFGKLVRELHPEKPFREAAEVYKAGEAIEANPTTRQSGKAAMARRLRELHGSATRIYDQIQTIRDVENKLREFVATESEFAMLSGADARVRAITTLGHKRGTLVGELFRSLALYKSFPLSIAFYHLGRGLSAPTIGGKVGYLSAFFAATTILGGLSVQAREILKGRDPMPMDTPEFWKMAMAQGGAITVAEALLEAENGFERVARVLAGPVPAAIEQAANLGISAAKEPFREDPQKVGGQAAKFTERFTPGSNLWYSRLAVQRLVWNNLVRLLDSDPEGAFQRQEENARKWGRGESWWRPGEILPERAPS